MFYHKCNTWFRLLHLLYDKDDTHKTIKHAFSMLYTLIKHGFDQPKSAQHPFNKIIIIIAGSKIYSKLQPEIFKAKTIRLFAILSSINYYYKIIPRRPTYRRSEFLSTVRDEEKNSFSHCNPQLMVV